MVYWNARYTKFKKNTDMCALQDIQLGRTDVKGFLDRYC